MSKISKVKTNGLKQNLTGAASSSECFERIREILTRSRNQALQAVNSAMVQAYWQIGQEIVEEEQRGKSRAGYGDQLIRELSAKLIRDFGPGFKVRNLWYMRSFYESFPKVHALRAELTWTHYRLLTKVSKPEARIFYQNECAQSRWSTRELERQINSLLYERLARSKDKKGLLALSNQGHEVTQPSDLIKDPYVLEFTGLPEPPHFQESELEQALMTHLQKFLLELGRDFFFVARQKRITIDGDHFYIDLVFYNRALRCFVLIDLKVGRLTQQDVGQMLLYTGYYEAENMAAGESPPIGLILCTDKNDAAVRYTLSKSSNTIFASKYKTILPSEEELVKELKKERELIEHEQSLQDSEE
jgi:predicted nuclease of restriction endonuclease-like (RecB) superfamily